MKPGAFVEEIPVIMTPGRMDVCQDVRTRKNNRKKNAKREQPLHPESVHTRVRQNGNQIDNNARVFLPRSLRWPPPLARTSQLCHGV